MNATINTMPETDNGSHQVPGMCYVPWQTFGKTYDPMRGLVAGTIFPELDKPFTGKCNMNMMQEGGGDDKTIFSANEPVGIVPLGYGTGLLCL